MVKSRSSQCIWSALDTAAAANLLRSLDPVQKVTVISPGEHKLPSSGCENVQVTLKQAIERAKGGIAISVPRNDTHDAFLLRGDTVYMLLSPESFAAFGLDGKKQGRGSKYLVVCNLSEKGRHLTRFKWALDNTINNVEFFLMKSPSTILDAKSRAVNILVPPLIVPPIQEEGAFDDWSNELIEWVGVAVLSPNLLAGAGSTVDPAICDYTAPEGSGLGSVSISHVAGLLQASDIEEVWNAVRNQEWAVLHVQAFRGSPIVWARDRANIGHGEAGYTLVRQDDIVSCFKYIA